MANKDYRSAITGRYMKKEDADKDLNTTIAETRKKRGRKPKKEKPDAKVENEKVESQENDRNPETELQPEAVEGHSEDANSERVEEVQEVSSGNIELPLSFIYKGKRYVEGLCLDDRSADEEAQEAILTKLLNMMGEE